MLAGVAGDMIVWFVSSTFASAFDVWNSCELCTCGNWSIGLALVVIRTGALTGFSLVWQIDAEFTGCSINVCCSLLFTVLELSINRNTVRWVDDVLSILSIWCGCVRIGWRLVSWGSTWVELTTGNMPRCAKCNCSDTNCNSSCCFIINCWSSSCLRCNWFWIWDCVEVIIASRCNISGTGCTATTGDGNPNGSIGFSAIVFS